MTKKVLDIPVAGKTVRISGVAADSREVGKNFLFVALAGLAHDGRAYIPDAIARGAVVILAPTGTTLPEGTKGVALLEDPNPRRRFAQIAAAFYGEQPEVIAAVTGTNGKTSTVNFARQIWTRLGRKAASLGTLGISAPGFEQYGAMTTPGPATLYAQVAELAETGVTHLAMEASSHGLDQSRLDGLRVMAAGFSNLTRDHLDYHGTVEAYFHAKARLFAEILDSSGVAVLNADVPESKALAEISRGRGCRVLTFGKEGRDIRLAELEPLPHGQRMVLEVLGRRYTVETQLIGAFQVWNMMCALGFVIGTDAALSADPEPAVKALAQLTGVKGRIERVAAHPNGAPVYVDYAHTPDGLETLLKSLRPHTRARLVVVFGCGGNRDRGKRPMMGEIAARLADVCIVTDDNPRNEAPSEIRQEILATCPKATEIGDRRAAIRAGVEMLLPEDVLVIAGKGHETGQIVGPDVLPFDDTEEARRAVAEVKA